MLCNGMGLKILQPRRKFFITFVDRIFTTFIERLFTTTSDPASQNAVIACVYRARNAD